MNTDTLKQLIKLDEERKDLEGKLKDIASKRREYEKQILDEFETEGIDSMNLIGKKVHLRRDLRTSVKGGDHDLATWYLWSVDLEVYSKANINASSISGYVREMDKGDDPLPEGFEDYFNISEMFSVRTLKA